MSSSYELISVDILIFFLTITKNVFDVKILKYFKLEGEETEPGKILTSFSADKI